jgi:hypothetical protein
VLVSVEQPLPVSSLGRLGDDLVALDEPRLGIVGRDQGGSRRGEGIGERQRVADPARDLERLFTDALAALAGRCVAKRRREPREQLDAKPAVFLAKTGERLLEQRDEPLVGYSVRPQHPSP